MRMLLEGRYRLYRCRTCRTQFLRAIDGSSGESRYWGDSERYKFRLYASEDVRLAYERRYRRILQRLLPGTASIGSVIDIGCGIGNFLAFAEAQGWKAVGFDVASKAAAEARSRNLTVYSEPEDLDRHVPDETVDLATLWDVIEHLLSPRPVLGAVARKLRPGGGLIIETPNAAFPLRPVARGMRRFSGGRLRRLSGRLYYWEHKTYFTARGLASLVEDEGFTVAKILRENSPRVKMSKLFEHGAAGGSSLNRFLARTWPLLDVGTRAAGLGNKLVLFATKPTTQAPPAARPVIASSDCF